jgi:hypothetical protein
MYSYIHRSHTIFNLLNPQQANAPLLPTTYLPNQAPPIQYTTYNLAPPPPQYDHLAFSHPNPQHYPLSLQHQSVYNGERKSMEAPVYAIPVTHYHHEPFHEKKAKKEIEEIDHVKSPKSPKINKVEEVDKLTETIDSPLSLSQKRTVKKKKHIEEGGIEEDQNTKNIKILRNLQESINEFMSDVERTLNNDLEGLGEMDFIDGELITGFRSLKQKLLKKVDVAIGNVHIYIYIYIYII